MQQWQYKAILDSDCGTNGELFNRMGLEGWEMYFILQISHDRIYYFKRKVA